jgi:hypothetical protein
MHAIRDCISDAMDAANVDEVEGVGQSAGTTTGYKKPVLVQLYLRNLQENPVLTKAITR